MWRQSCTVEKSVVEHPYAATQQDQTGHTSKCSSWASSAAASSAKPVLALAVLYIKPSHLYGTPLSLLLHTLHVLLQICPHLPWVGHLGGIRELEGDGNM